MSRAYISDSVFDGSGKPVMGAAVVLLRANDFTSPPATDPGPSFYVATAVSAAGGVFAFDHLTPDDYHLMVRYAGQTSFRYFVPALPVDASMTRENMGRNLVPRTLSRLLARENVTIYAVGDEVTVGYNATGTVAGSWVHRLGVLIGQQLTPQALVVRYDPSAYGSLTDGPIAGFSGPTPIQAASGGSSQTVRMVNCGVNRDTVQRVLRRAGANLVTPAYGPVDLFLIQLGLNDSWTLDAQRFVDPDTFARGVRALVDVLRSTLFGAEIALLTPACSSQPDAGNGGLVPAGTYSLEQYAMGIRRAALDTGCALVDARQLFADRLNTADPNFAAGDGYGSWLSTAGSNHANPTDAGHQAIAEEVFKVFGTPGLAAGRPMRIQAAGPMPLYKSVETCRLAASNPALLYAGGHWTSYTPSALADLYLSAGSGLQRSRTAGDTMTFRDRMLDFALLVRRGPDCGQMSVAVDGGSAATYDLYRGVPADVSDTNADGSVYPMELFWLARGLADAVHTVVITVLGTKSPLATDSYVYVDGVSYSRASYSSRRVETPGDANANLQFGTFVVSMVAAPNGVVTVNFPAPFRNNVTPVVMALCSDKEWYCSVQNAGPTSADIHIQHRDGSNATTAVGGTWLAVG